jgi:hypothetical protein
MPSLPNVLLCALAELLVSLGVGLPLARRLVDVRPLALATAPIVGWAVFNALALPVLTLLGFTRLKVALVCGAAIFAGTAALRRGSVREPAKAGGVAASAGLVTAAALLAIVPTLAVWPKYAMGGVLLSEAMFDHSKAAIIDEIVRQGLPPGNPFFADAGPRLVYYYLWHFSAAVPAVIFGATGWEADAALTWFTAFASLGLMIGLAGMLGATRTAALMVVPLVLSASLRPVLRLVLPPGFRDQALSQWPQAWLFQTSWAPQHVAAAGCVVVAVLALWRLTGPRDRLMVALLAVVAAAGFESSAWVGGVIFAAAAVPIAIAFLAMADSNRARLELILAVAAAALLALAIAFPFLRDEFAATAARHAGAPIAFRPFGVLGQMVPLAIRPFLNIAAYWLIVPTIEFPAISFAGVWAIAGAVAARVALSLPPERPRWRAPTDLIRGLKAHVRGFPRHPRVTPGFSADEPSPRVSRPTGHRHRIPGAGGGEGKEGWAEPRLVIALVVLAGISFVVPSCFASTIANNDLGWRGVLPGIVILTAFAANGSLRWLAQSLQNLSRVSPAPGLRRRWLRGGHAINRNASEGVNIALPTARGWALGVLVFWVLGLLGGLQVARDNAVGLYASSANSLGQAPALWAAVRHQTAANERVANNPAFLGTSVRWPVNISWALLANRRSCYAGWNLARAFVPLPEAEIDATAKLFKRVFAGDGTHDDVRRLAIRFDCDVVVVTLSDGAWLRDPFAASPDYRLAEERAGKWRIYRKADR